MIFVDLSVENITPFLVWAYAKIPHPSEEEKKEKIQQGSNLNEISIITLSPLPFIRANKTIGHVFGC